MIFYFLWFFLTTPAVQKASSNLSTATAVNYGQAEIAQVLEVFPDFHLLCNIRNYPPVVGEQMPVYIRGLQPGGTQADAKVQTYLQTLLCKQPRDPNQVILLKNIQRGQSFCLIADLEINGRDVGDFLVQQGLVERILKAPAAEKTAGPAPETPAAPSMVLQPIAPVSSPIKTSPQPSQGYIASKGSRIFHRVGCPHAARITEEQRILFRTRDEAASGRRPCKTCNP
ncbi:MAG TPA: hypothetical protein PKY88_04535 [Anaerohalosphaeraceae bacterium]|nr:hypothetical protein [Anaerohalosphaeraceae bacterium]